MARIGVVTDSTAYLPRALATRLDIEVVPLAVIVEGESFLEGGEGSEAIVAALRRGIPATTSKPTPEAFAEAYQRAEARGCDGVVSVHLSSKMSGTVDSALLAASRATIPVRVIDTRIMGMGVGFAALAAAHAADERLSLDEVAEAASLRATTSSAFFTVSTLEYLRRSGRIGRAQALLGTALAVKPILTLGDGEVVALEKVRTTERAYARIEELAVEAAGSRAVDVAVHHLGLDEKAEALAARIAEQLGPISDVLVAEVGAVVGAHTGPGTLGVIVAPRL
jgi:DegV family protein with EDD domain